MDSSEAHTPVFPKTEMNEGAMDVPFDPFRLNDDEINDEKSNAKPVLPTTQPCIERIAGRPATIHIHQQHHNHYHTGKSGRQSRQGDWRRRAATKKRTVATKRTEPPQVQRVPVLTQQSSPEPNKQLLLPKPLIEITKNHESGPTRLSLSNKAADGTVEHKRLHVAIPPVVDGDVASIATTAMESRDGDSDDSSATMVRVILLEDSQDGNKDTGCNTEDDYKRDHNANETALDFDTSWRPFGKNASSSSFDASIRHSQELQQQQQQQQQQGQSQDVGQAPDVSQNIVQVKSKWTEYRRSSTISTDSESDYEQADNGDKNDEMTLNILRSELASISDALWDHRTRVQERVQSNAHRAVFLPEP